MNGPPVTRWERVSPLMAATVLLIGAALKYPDVYAMAFMAAGFVLLGAWLAVEIGHIVQRRLETLPQPDDPRTEVRDGGR